MTLHIADELTLPLELAGRTQVIMKARCAARMKGPQI